MALGSDMSLGGNVRRGQEPGRRLDYGMGQEGLVGPEGCKSLSVRDRGLGWHNSLQ